jgi:hypothetical protein
VLTKDEIAIVKPDSTDSDYKIAFGDGITEMKSLPYALNNDITEKPVKSFDTVSDADPSLSAGSTLKNLFAVIAKKFTYLANNKLDKSSVLDVVNSTNTTAALSANQGRALQEQITTLNSNLGGKIVVHTFTFDSSSVTQTFTFGSSYSKVPHVISGRIGNDVIMNNVHITQLEISTSALTITRDSANSYAGSVFYIALLIRG